MKLTNKKRHESRKRIAFARQWFDQYAATRYKNESILEGTQCLADLKKASTGERAWDVIQKITFFGALLLLVWATL